jgi:hypothetical protein
MHRVETALDGWLAAGAGTRPTWADIDAMAPALTTRSEFVTRLFEAEVRPLVLAEVVPLEGRDRRAVEVFRRELVGLFEQMRDYSSYLRTIREELVRLGF